VLGQPWGDEADLKCDCAECDRPTQHLVAAGPSYRCAVLCRRNIRDVDGGHKGVSLSPAATPTTPGILLLAFG
jgi:hypothetical protein